MRRICGAIFALALVVPVFACGGGEPEETPTPESPAAEAPPPDTGTEAAATLPPGVTIQTVQQGRELYGTVCVSCHGQEGVGTQLGPALNDAQWINIGGEFDQIVNVIRSGVMRPRQYPSPMPPMDVDDFTAEQVRALAAYVYSISPRS